MRKTLSISIALLTVLAACQKEQQAPVVEELADASISTSAPVTRTALNGKAVEWLAGDAIAVFPDGGAVREFTTPAAGKTVTFTGKVPYGAKMMYAVYPYDASLSYASGKVGVSLPAGQKAVKGGFDDDLAILTATGAFTDYAASVTFKQVCGLIKCTVSSSDITSIEFIAPDGAQVAGDAFIDFAQSAPSVTKAEHSVTLSSDSKLEAGDYYFTVYPFTAEGCKLIYRSGERTKTVEIPDAIKVGRAGIATIGGSDADHRWDDEAPSDKGVKVGSTELTETSSGIFEGTVDMQAKSSFYVSIDGTDYGYVPFSGAGGIGKVEDGNSALPFYNMATAMTRKSDYGYSVRRAIMRLAKDGGQLYTNMPSACKVFVRVDRSGSAPVCFLQAVEQADASVVFHEDFDLMTCGGDYMVAIAGTSTNPEKDGLTDNAKGGKTANQMSAFDYPAAVSQPLASETYMKNRGVDDWEFAFGGERPGAIQLCSGTVGGYMVTPKFASLDSATDVTVTLDIARFSGTSTGDITVILQGGGEFESATVSTEPYEANGTPALTKTYSGLSGSSFVIADDQYCPHTSGNNDYDKPHSVYVFKAKGVTSATSIKIDAPKQGSNAPRCFIFDIKVTK